MSMYHSRSTHATHYMHDETRVVPYAVSVIHKRSWVHESVNRRRCGAFFLLYCRKTVIPETSLQRVKTNLVRKVHSR